MDSRACIGRSITEMYVERIERLDKQVPSINYVIELNPDALAIADALVRSEKGRVPAARFTASG